MEEDDDDDDEIANLRLLTNIDIGVNRIPYNLTFLCTTCNQPF